MGNSPPTGGLRLPNTDCSYVVTVGQSVTIEFRGRKVEKGNEEGENTETWEMVYNSGTRNCFFSLSKSFRNTTHHDDKLHILIKDTAPGLNQFFGVTLTNGNEEGLLYYAEEPSWRSKYLRVHDFYSFTTNAYGEFTHTVFDIYGNDKTKGLIVREYKSRSKDKTPYMVNVACYYLNANIGADFDVGISVIVKRIRKLCNGNFDFAVDGPELHPVDALAYMFKEVLRTKTCKPTDCPHCAKRYILERQSECESEADDVPVAPSSVHGRQQNAGSIVSNPGWFRGNNNGNTFIKYFNGRKLKDKMMYL